ncbi:unnamed protein product [Closterium sp. NIES-53]
MCDVSDRKRPQKIWSSRMDHGGASNLHNQANAALTDPILLWRGRKRERLGDALLTTKVLKETRGKLTCMVRVQMEYREVLVEPCAQLATNSADRGDQNSTDVSSALQGKLHGVAHEVVNDEQKVVLLAQPRDGGGAPHVHVQLLKRSSGRMKRGVRNGALPPLDAGSARRLKRPREWGQGPGKSRDKETRRPAGFTGSFPDGTQWQLHRPVYGPCHAPRESHDTLRTTLAALDFFSSFAHTSLFVRHISTPFFFLVYIDDLIFATHDRRTLASVKEELQRRHNCTDLGELQHYLGLQITGERAARTITLTQSHMVEQILTRFHFPFSKVQLTPLTVDHGLTAPPSDEPFESNGPYLELVGCLMYLMTCTHPDLANPLSVLARFVAPGRHRPFH